MAKDITNPLEAPDGFNYMGQVSMGFWQDRITGKMTVTVKPKPADENDKTAMAITALYAAAVQKSLEAISSSVAQTGLLDQLRKLN
jgi:hypothetical protein